MRPPWGICVVIFCLALAGCAEADSEWRVRVTHGGELCDQDSLTITEPVTRGTDEIVSWGVLARDDAGRVGGPVVVLADTVPQVTGDAAGIEPVGVLVAALYERAPDQDVDLPLDTVESAAALDERLQMLAPQVAPDEQRLFLTRYGAPMSVGFEVSCGDSSYTGELHAYAVNSQGLGPCSSTDADEDAAEAELRLRACEGDLAGLDPNDRD